MSKNSGERYRNSRKVKRHSRNTAKVSKRRATKSNAVNQWQRETEATSFTSESESGEEDSEVDSEDEDSVGSLTRKRTKEQHRNRRTYIVRNGKYGVGLKYRVKNEELNFYGVAKWGKTEDKNFLYREFERGEPQIIYDVNNDRHGDTKEIIDESRLTLRRNGGPRHRFKFNLAATTNDLEKLSDDDDDQSTGRFANNRESAAGSQGTDEDDQGRTAFIAALEKHFSALVIEGPTFETVGGPPRYQFKSRSDGSVQFAHVENGLRSLSALLESVENGGTSSPAGLLRFVVNVADEEGDYPMDHIGGLNADETALANQAVLTSGSINHAVHDYATAPGEVHDVTVPRFNSTVKLAATYWFKHVAPGGRRQYHGFARYGGEIGVPMLTMCEDYITAANTWLTAFDTSHYPFRRWSKLPFSDNIVSEGLTRVKIAAHYDDGLQVAANLSKIMCGIPPELPETFRMLSQMAYRFSTNVARALSALECGMESDALARQSNITMLADAEIASLQSKLQDAENSLFASELRVQALEQIIEDAKAVDHSQQAATYNEMVFYSDANKVVTPPYNFNSSSLSGALEVQK